MHVISCFKNESFFGMNTSVLKSGICKYFRRSEFDKFKCCVVEMWKFIECVEEEKEINGKLKKYKNGACVLTNLLNRLKILLMEDVSSLEGFRVVEGIKLLDAWDKNRERGELLFNFCELLENSRRSRAVSYLKNYWKFESKEELNRDIVLDKVLEFRKKGDDENLLRMGEELIECMANRSEKIVKIFCEMFCLEGKFGRRYRRSDGVYLFWEIMENSKIINKDIFNFGLNMFFRKSMREREAFGVWICLLFLKRDDMRWDEIEYKKWSQNDVLNYEKNRMKLKIDDYVVNDWHVNKNYDLSCFRNNGAFVKNEEKVLERNDEYENFYKNKKVEVKKVEVKKVEVKKVEVKNEDLDFIDWKEFENVEILEEGVCGGKVCCIKILYKGLKYILKEMKKSMNYGVDYELIDGLKENVGLVSIGMKRIISNGGLIKYDPKKGYRGNCRIGDRDKVIYCMMRYVDNMGDAGKNKKIIVENKLMREVLKIRLFNGLFRCSDNIMRNILVINNGKGLLSIDENDVFGKRKNIFNKNDWCKGKYSRSEVIEIIKDLKENLEKNKVVSKMEEYGFSGDKIKEFEYRFDSYEEVVLKELV